MQPQMAKKIEQATRKEFPGRHPGVRHRCAAFHLRLARHPGRDIKFDLGRIEGYRNFCNKLWNAARYVLMNTEGQDCGLTGEIELNAADRWIVSRLNEVAAEAETAFREYRFDLAAQALYSFTWNEYCDWYLELSKVVLTIPRRAPPRSAVRAPPWCRCWKRCYACYTRSRRSSPRRSGSASPPWRENPVRPSCANPTR